MKKKFIIILFYLFFMILATINIIFCIKNNCTNNLVYFVSCIYNLVSTMYIYIEIKGEQND